MSSHSPAGGNPAQLAALYRMGLLDAVADGSFDRLTRLASQVLHVPVAFVMVIGEHGPILQSARGLPGMTAFGCEEPLLGDLGEPILARGERRVVEDVAQCPWLRGNPAVDELGITSFLGVPLGTGDGPVLGSFCVADFLPRRWTAEQVEILDGLAASACSEIELRRAVQAVAAGDVELRRRESYYRTLIERSSDLIMVLDQDGTIRFTSTSVKRILGWTGDHTLGVRALEFVHPDDADRVEGLITDLIVHHGRSTEFQFRFRTAAGGWRVLDSVVTNLLRHPVVGAIVVNSRDVTARHEAEAALHASEARLLRQNQALVEIAREQSRSGDTFDHAVRRITGVAASTLAVDRVSVWVFEPDRGAMQCLDRFDARSGRHSSGYEMGTAAAARVHALEDARTAAHEDAAPADAPADGAPGRSLLDAAIRVGGEVVGAVRYEHFGGGRAWSLDEHGFAGSTADLIAVALESSERRVAQELNRRLASIVEGSDDAIFSLSRHGRILSWNSGAERIYGYRSDEIVGRPVTRLLPAERASEEFQILARLERGEQVDHYETVHIRMDGALIHISLTLSPIRDERGRITSIGGIARDITSWREAQAVLIQAKDAAEAANRTKSHFLSSMSHELRTPLNSVIGFASVLRKNRGGTMLPQDIQYLDRILANGTHLLGLINDILDLSKIEAGSLELELSTVDLARLVSDTVSELQGSVRPLVDVVTEVPPRAGPMEADAGKLKQVLINLIGNALKFTDRGRVTVSVATDARTGRPLRIDVRDTGIGIPRERLGSIFHAFQQGESGTARRFGGTGLGLAITASLCERMGYTVVVESEEGVGSTFSVLLYPVLRDDGAQGGVEGLARPGSGGRPVDLRHGPPSAPVHRA